MVKLLHQKCIGLHKILCFQIHIINEARMGGGQQGMYTFPYWRYTRGFLV